VTFNASGVFNLAALEFVKKGLAAEGALLSTLRKAKAFSLDSANKLFESIIQSTSLYAAGIWGLESGKILERVQQH
jgi:hypothetical protein